MDSAAVTIEDPIVAKEAETKDEAKGDTSISVEETPSAESESHNSKEDENIPPTLVINGASNTVEENSIAAQIPAEVIEPVTADSNKVDVESTRSGTEETPKAEKVTESVEAPKQNGPEAPTTEKIEVKDKTDVEIVTSSDDSSALIQQETQNLNEIKSDGGSEVVQNPPPPPLPSTPAPSQVMVFALSDSKSPEQEQQIPSTVMETNSTPDVILSAEKSIEPMEANKCHEELLTNKSTEPTLIENVDSSTNSEIIIPEKIITSETETKQIEKPIEECTKPTPETETSLESSLEKTETKETIEPQLAEQCQTISNISENISEAENIVNAILTSKDKSDLEINPEQIAETIALIDEVTKEAAEKTQQQLVAQEVNRTENQQEISIKCTESETSCNAPNPADSVPKAPETTSSTENQISSENSSPVEKNILDTKSNDENQNITVSSSKPIDIDSGADTSKTENAENNIKQILPIETTEVQLKNDDEPVSCCAEITKVIESPADVAKSSPTTKSKENGVDDTHELIAETSTTESLPEHNKTIEEIKLEQQQTEKKLTEVMAETATGTASE